MGLTPPPIWTMFKKTSLFPRDGFPNKRHKTCGSINKSLHLYVWLSQGIIANSWKGSQVWYILDILWRSALWGWWEPSDKVSGFFLPPECHTNTQAPGMLTQYVLAMPITSSSPRSSPPSSGWGITLRRKWQKNVHEEPYFRSLSVSNHPPSQACSEAHKMILNLPSP